MLAVRTPGAPQAACEVAVFDSAFPFERQGRLLRSRSISGLFSRSLHSGLQPPCLGFATAVIADGRLQRACKAQLPHHRAYGSVHGGSRSYANTIGTRMAGRAI